MGRAGNTGRENRKHFLNPIASEARILKFLDFNFGSLNGDVSCAPPDVCGLRKGRKRSSAAGTLVHTIHVSLLCGRGGR